MKCSFSKTFSKCSFSSVFFLVPFSLFAAAIIMVLVARFDESFKPCPITIYVKSKSKTQTSGTYIFPNFCGQTMNPRVTTCCRVPCFQNFTTYFDLDGNPDDCISQPFASMSVAVVGFVLLGLSLPMLLMVGLEHVLKIKNKSRDRSIIEETFCLPNRFPRVTAAATAQSIFDQEAISGIGKDAAAAHAFPTDAIAGELQVV
jgi:ABC-type sugar transport system permease subunit